MGLRKKSGVYKIVCAANSKVYVGSAVDLYRRKMEHRRDLLHNRHRNIHLQRAWNKYGREAFSFRLIELTTVDQLLEREQYWLDEYKAYAPKIGFNIARSTTAPTLGRTPTKETREKLSIANKGEMNPMYGRSGELSPLWGRPRTQEERQRISEANKGRPVLPETREKISASLMGKMTGQRNSASRMITWENKTLNLHQWGEELGISQFTLATRLQNGWTVERAFTTRPRVGNYHGSIPRADWITSVNP